MISTMHSKQREELEDLENEMMAAVTSGATPSMIRRWRKQLHSTRYQLGRFPPAGYTGGADQPATSRTTDPEHIDGVLGNVQAALLDVAESDSLDPEEAGRLADLVEEVRDALHPTPSAEAA